jgi:hypothetical protein
MLEVTRVRRRTRAGLLAAAAALGLVAASAAGCSVRSHLAADSTASRLGSADPITAQRARYIETMLANSYSSGPETESGIMSVIAGYGGGYVTDASLSGAPGPTEKLTLGVVLGGGSVSDSMQDETDYNPSGIACYTFTVGYYDYTGTKTQVTCPHSLTVGSARKTAQRQIAEQIGSEHDDATLTAIPTTPAAAERAIGLTGAGSAAARALITPADFATGTDAVQHKPDAALALPQSGGGCVYVAYRWVQASSAFGGGAGTAETALARAWAAPTDAACTGSAALAASGFLTVDRYAGG